MKKKSFDNTFNTPIIPGQDSILPQLFPPEKYHIPSQNKRLKWIKDWYIKNKGVLGPEYYKMQPTTVGKVPDSNVIYEHTGLDRLTFRGGKDMDIRDLAWNYYLNSDLPKSIKKRIEEYQNDLFEDIKNYFEEKHIEVDDWTIARIVDYIFDKAYGLTK